MKRLLIVGALVLAVPAAAHAATTYKLSRTIAPGARVALTTGKLGMGEFSFSLRASSDADKRFILTQARGTRAPFAVLISPSTMSADVCQGAAGSLFCSGFQTPAPVAGSTYTFRIRNRGVRPLTVNLTVTWKRITSAG